MAPYSQTTTAGKKDKRVDAILAFAQETQKRLPNLRDKNQIQYLNDELEKQIRTAKSLLTHGFQRREQLNLTGTDLWNLCVRLNHDNEDQLLSFRRTITLCRVLAFELLMLATDINNNAPPNDLIRLAKLAIKSGKSCINAGEIEFALLVLQKAVDYNGILQKLEDELSEDEQTIRRRLEAEYFILRTVLSWKEGRLDVAEHMYAKSESLLQRLDSISAESLADALYEIGNDLLQKSDFLMAVKWLERAYELINNQELEQLSREAVELRLSILHSLVHSLLGLESTESFKRAENHVACVESELGNKLVVLLLRLEILQKVPAEVFDSEAYANILRRMVRSTALSDSTFKLLTSHIRRLYDKSPTLAFQVLDQFLLEKLVPSEKLEWIEHALLLRVLLATIHRDISETVDNLKLVFDHTAEGLGRALTVNPAQAILTLLWKKVESHSAQGQLDLCESWCHLATHMLLEQRGLINTGKIGRKLILCALERNDLDTAREVLMSMDEGTRSQPMTIYLALKLALRIDDSELASGDKVCTLKALKLLAERNGFGQDGEIHFPALLRSIIRVQSSFLEARDAAVDTEIVVDDLCKTFEGVVTMLKRDPQAPDGTKLFTIPEINWFSKNAYNLGIKHVSNWKLRFVIRILDACISIAQHYPRDMPRHEMGDILLRDMFCHFMIATSYIALARSEDNIETQLQDYLNSRKHVRAFETRLEHMPSNDEECHHDLRLKLATLFVFDFEACIHLKAWDELVTIARKSGTYKDLQTLQAIADSLLRAQPPTQVVYSTLRSIINDIFKLEKFDNGKLAKYMRCLMNITMSDAKLSLMLIEEISVMVKQAAETKKSFPEVELEWFATTSYNQAIDYNLSREDELSRKWIGHAFTLAYHLHDGGVLEKTMQKCYTKLSWGPG
ncbi:hypothetical protein TruAng_000538 [Truncatella angustata]|nr:hypothetical protein TruAng_000538 [Truncatella angustata]